MEELHPEKRPDGKIRAAIFDFDGTFSTLRHGWENVMGPLMLEMISGGRAEDASPELQKEVAEFIDRSTGIQTVYQMQWLRDRCHAAGTGVATWDEWDYKDEYNRRLMAEVSRRLSRLEDGTDSPDTYLIHGAKEFLHALLEAGVRVYLASGTDHDDVVREATLLGVADCFTAVRGAPKRMAACSKEAVIKMILEEEGVAPCEVLVVGDGKVEIELGAAVGAFTIGAATNEGARQGVDETKRRRLISAGADVIVGDFGDVEGLMSRLGF